MKVRIGDSYYRTGTEGRERGAVTELHDNFNHAILKMVDGSNKAVPYKTLLNQKYWTSISPEEIKKIEKLSEAGKETTEVEKNMNTMEVEEIKEAGNAENAENAKKVKKMRKTDSEKKPDSDSGDVAEVKDFIIKTAEGLGATSCESGRFISLKIGGKMFAAIFSSSKKSLTFGVRSSAVSTLDVEPAAKAHHMMDYRFKFTSMDDKKLIEDLLRSSCEYQVLKNKKSKEEK